MSPKYKGTKIASCSVIKHHLFQIVCWHSSVLGIVQKRTPDYPLFGWSGTKQGEMAKLVDASSATNVEMIGLQLNV